MTKETAGKLEAAPIPATTPTGRDAGAPPKAVRQRTAFGPPLRQSLGLITLAWVFGAVWMNCTTGAPLTLFARGLGASKFQFGLLAALPFVASLVSVPASLLIERTGLRKTFFLHGLYLQRALWFVIALAPLWVVCRWGPAASGQAVTLLLSLAFLMYASGAFSSPAWVSWMADVVPDRVRGTYFSRRRQWGILTAVPAVLLVGWLLDHQAGAATAGTTVSTAATAAAANTNTPVPVAPGVLRWCALIFMGAAVCGLADIAMFQAVPEVPHPRRSGAELLKGLGEPLRDRRFLTFSGLVATLTFAVSFMNQFVTLYLIEKAHVDNTGTQLMLLVGPMVAQLFVLPVWGKAADRMGKRPVLAVASMGLVPVGLGWCCTTGTNPWLGYLLSAAGAALWTGVEVANFNLVLEMSDSAEGKRGSKSPVAAPRASGGSAYAAVNSVIVNVAGCMGGLAAGTLAQGLRDWAWQPVAGGKTFTFYDVLFALSGVLRLAAVVIFVPLIHEPAARGTAEAVRFMAGCLRENLHAVLLMPLRLFQPQRTTVVVTACVPPAEIEQTGANEDEGRTWKLGEPERLGGVAA